MKVINIETSTNQIIASLEDFVKKVIVLLKDFFKIEENNDATIKIFEEEMLYCKIKENNEDLNKFNEVFNTRNNEKLSILLTSNYNKLKIFLESSSSETQNLLSSYNFFYSHLSIDIAYYNCLKESKKAFPNKHKKEYYIEKFNKNFLINCNVSEIINTLILLKNKNFLTCTLNNNRRQDPLINKLRNSVYKFSIKSDNPRLIDFVQYLSQHGKDNYIHTAYINLDPKLFIISNDELVVNIIIESNSYNIIKHMYNKYENKIIYATNEGANLSDEEYNNSSKLINENTLIKAIKNRAANTVKAILEFDVNINKQCEFSNQDKNLTQIQSPIELAKNCYETSTLDDTYAEENGYHLIYCILYKKQLGEEFKSKLTTASQKNHCKDINFKFKQDYK